MAAVAANILESRSGGALRGPHVAGEEVGVGSANRSEKKGKETEGGGGEQVREGGRWE